MSARTSKLGRYRAALLLTAIVATAWFTAPHLYRGYEALLTLLDLANRALPAALDSRPAVIRDEIQWEAGDRYGRGDLYRATGALAGIVLIPGAAPQGKDDPRAIALATALARARFTVLVPDIIDLRALKLVPESARDVAAALRYMLARPGLAPAGRAGLLTTSVGVGPAVLAVSDPSLSHRVQFFVSIGGYHDLPRTLAYLTTGHYDAFGVSLKRPPNDHGKWAYALSNAGRLNTVKDRRLFSAMARRKLGDPQARVDDLLAKLGPEAVRIYDFVTNEDPSRSRAYLERLPPAQRADLAALNLASRDLRGLKLRFILVHGLDDPVIPYGESLALASALAPGRAETFLVRGLLHVDVAPDLMDGFQMWRAIYTLLSERHAGADPPR